MNEAIRQSSVHGLNKILGLEKTKLLTQLPFAVHNQLENEGFDTESDEYYTELNNRVQKELPHKFNVEADNKPVQTVASANTQYIDRTQTKSYRIDTERTSIS